MHAELHVYELVRHQPHRLHTNLTHLTSAPHCTAPHTLQTLADGAECDGRGWPQGEQGILFTARMRTHSVEEQRGQNVRGE
jgi:hypothetical protein